MTNLLLQLQQPPRPPVHRAMVREKAAQPPPYPAEQAGGVKSFRRRWRRIVFIGVLALAVALLLALMMLR
jgi:hypothetical protein